jgi:predicted RNase H-like nuclease (RuvC/YqgF family)
MEKEIRELKSQLVHLDSSNKKLSDNLAQIETSFDQYVLLSSEIMSKQEAVVELYKEIVESRQMLGGLLSISEKHVIKSEINLAKQAGMQEPRVQRVQDCKCTPSLLHFQLCGCSAGAD